MSSSPSTPTLSARSKKVLVPKVWKRPHSTIYGKNVEYGSSLYSDKIGEINGRKFNSELPWQVRNSGSATTASSSGSSAYNQGYLSNLLIDARDINKCSNYADLLAITNPARGSLSGSGSSFRRSARGAAAAGGGSGGRIDFYENYMDFSREIETLSGSSLLRLEPQLTRKVFDYFLDFDYELGLFVPTHKIQNAINANARRPLVAAVGGGGLDLGRHRKGCYSSSSSLMSRRPLDDYSDTSLLSKGYLDINQPSPSTTKRYERLANDQLDDHDDCHYNQYKPTLCSQMHPIKLMHQNTQLLPKHRCQMESSPYGQSLDGRKLSLSTINPHSYRPNVSQKTTTAHASDGEEFEFQDKSSPFYTDRWAGKTIRHFDSDLYSNANLFKSMIL